MVYKDKILEISYIICYTISYTIKDDYQLFIITCYTL